MAEIETKLAELGFGIPLHVQGRSSIADLFRDKRCGIYVLHFLDGTHYAGKSVNVVRRYAEHLRTHTDIQKISFKHVLAEQLDAEEHFVIRNLDSSGFYLRNIEIVTFSYGETDFDLIMSPEEQDTWLDDLMGKRKQIQMIRQNTDAQKRVPTGSGFVETAFWPSAEIVSIGNRLSISYNDLNGNRVVNEQLRSRYERKFQRLEKLPYAEEIIDVTRQYVQASIPAVKRGEISFWNCSCLSNLPKELYIRINLGGQTTFDALVVDGKPYFRWYVTRSLAEEVFDISLEEVNHEFDMIISELQEHPGAEIHIVKSDLVKGGPDQVFIIVEGIPVALSVLKDEYMLAAVRLFNLGLVKKGPCLWGKNHCLDLADRLIE